MNPDFSVRPLTDADAESASEIARRSFTAHVACDWEASACELFHARSTPEFLRSTLESCAYAAAAFDADSMLGFILMPQPAFVRMLFVRPDCMRKGVGRALWEAARAHIEHGFPKVATVELNSSLHAVGFYRRLGFAALSAPYLRDGSRAVRMACWLPARSLDAAP